MRLFDAVLVTGCRFEIAQSVCRILKQSGTVGVVVGSDFHAEHPGAFVCDHVELTEAVDDPRYFDSIRRIVDAHHIDLIVPMSEAEIFRFADGGFADDFGGVPVLMADRRSLAVGRDKLSIIEFLARHRLAHPWTLLAGLHDPPQIPCIMKPRRGNESDGVLLVDDADFIPILRRTRPADIWQELLLPADAEYTCALFRSTSNAFRSLIMRRQLRGGSSVAGEVVHAPVIERYLQTIAVALDLKGAVNVQLRVTGDGPVAFELNSRFSSTVMCRHLMGFQDVIWAMTDARGLPLPPYEPVGHGTRFYRGSVEYIVPRDTAPETPSAR